MRSIKTIVSLVLALMIAMSAVTVFPVPVGAKTVVAVENTSGNETPFYGDVDGDSQITMRDVLKLRRFLVGAEDLSPELLVNADVDFDGNYTMKDVLKLRRVIAGAETIVPPVPDAASLVDDAFIDPSADWDQYDALIDSIRTETDRAKRTEMMHRAEDILMATNCVIPLYYYNDVYLQKGCVSGVYSSVYGTKYFMYSRLDDGSKTLRLCLGGEPDYLDPALNSSVDGACLISNLFSGLYTYGADGQCVPACAAGYTVSADGRTYTVTEERAQMVRRNASHGSRFRVCVE